MLNKKLLNEIFIIVFMGVAIAVIYNMVNPDRLDFLPKDKSELVVPDSLLFDFVVPTEKEPISQDTLLQNIEPTEKIDDVAAVKKSDEVVQKKIDTAIKTAESPKNDITDLSNASHSSGDFRIVTFEQMKRITESQGFIIVDARQPEQFAKSHIPKSINLFPYMDESELMPKLLALPREKTIVIYCDGGNCDLSHEIGNMLKNFGYNRIFLYEGGWDEWSRRIGN